MNAFSIENLRQRAKRCLPKAVFDMADGGAEDEKSLIYNREIFNRFYFVPRALQDVSQRLLTASFLGKAIDLPLAIAPMGMTGLLYPKADLAIAKAAKSMGMPYTLSTMATSTIEEIATIGGYYGFQLYVLKNRRMTEALVERAHNAQYQFLMLTVDFPLSGKRERDLKNRFTMPYRPSTANLFDFAMHPRWSFNLLRHGMPTLVNLQKEAQENVQALYAVLNRELDPSLTWEDLKWLRKIWQKPLLIKGLLAVEDCKMAFDHGADGGDFIQSWWQTVGWRHRPTCRLAGDQAIFRQRGSNFHRQRLSSRHGCHQSAVSWRKRRLFRQGHVVWRGSRW